MNHAASPLPAADWVFGYGSLMWNPGFAYEERRSAVVRGLHRALCIWSHVHRGTPERPGLVLGLDRGGSCRGVAFRVAPERWAETVDYLRRREQATSVYIETVHEVAFDDGRKVRALAYRADRTHRQYCGRLPDETLLEVVRGGVGLSGANPDYVLATHDHLVELGIADRTLDWLAHRLRA
ncbi:gamma-glutamylcyclotransferase [Labrys monachus]|uniref:glutathione-specific gamma-glutamylcyclotransferase n=1 Tax=Labrys monachus TaxID=217067 RepID=A0ABU0F6R5_9HYPH|nr:gamma-glutamylcyclotransferase [Labrys monachus]MDQ0390246.1 cation transport protein ChaC [Labrys monachus]